MHFVVTIDGPSAAGKSTTARAVASRMGFLYVDTGALYRALARGYLEGLGATLDPAELELLPLAGPLIALETGVRFLTDHLEGDRYFRVARADHNRDRARTQMQLTRSLLADLASGRRILREAAAARSS